MTRLSDKVCLLFCFPLISAIIGLTCASNINCLNVLSNTECKSLQCACVSGYTGSTGTTCTGKY